MAEKLTKAIPQSQILAKMAANHANIKRRPFQAHNYRERVLENFSYTFIHFNRHGAAVLIDAAQNFYVR